MAWSLFALRASSVYHIAWPLRRDLSKAKQSTLGINQNPHIVGIYRTSFEEKSLSVVYHDWHFRDICKDESYTVYSRSVLGRLVYSTVHTCSTYRAIYIVDRPSTVDFKVRSLAPPPPKKKCPKSSNFHFFFLQKTSRSISIQNWLFSFLKKRKSTFAERPTFIFQVIFLYVFSSSLFFFLFHVGGWLVYFAACWQAPGARWLGIKREKVISPLDTHSTYYSTLG
jgi:hypothetical protein